MKITHKKLSDLTPYAHNPRLNDAAVEAVANSIRDFGFLVPIVIDKTGTIVAGHTRLKAAQSLGLTTVPTVNAGNLTEQQIKAFRLADNKTAELADWDFDKLKIELDELADFDMTAFGFDFPDPDGDTVPGSPGTYHEKFSVVVDCENEQQQQTVYNLLTENGYTPRIVSL
jgi:hypothetical protein